MQAWTSQPKGPVRINRANRLTSGLKEMGIFSQFRTIHNRALPTISGGAEPYFQPFNGAQCFKQASTEALAFSASEPWHQITTGQMSFGFVFYQGATTANTRVFFQNMSAGAGFKFQTISSNWEFQINGSTTPVVCTGPAATVGKHTVVAVADGSNLMLYIDGILRNTVASAAYGNGTPSTFQFGGFGISALHESWALWERALTPGEVAEFTRNPYQMLVPNRSKTLITGSVNVVPRPTGLLRFLLREL